MCIENEDLKNYCYRIDEPLKYVMVKKSASAFCDTRHHLHVIPMKWPSNSIFEVTGIGLSTSFPSKFRNTVFFTKENIVLAVECCIPIKIEDINLSKKELIFKYN